MPKSGRASGGRAHTAGSRSGGFRLPRASGALALLVLAGGGLYLMVAPDQRLGEAALGGHAHAVDGDTLGLGRARIRLIGMDAPERDQTCKDAAGADWACGAAAHRELSTLVAARTIDCVPQGHDRYGRVLARCTAGGTDVAAAIVVAGLAIANGDYGREEAEARAARRGIWAGTFETPRSWREGVRGFDLWTWIRSWFG